MFEKAGSFDCYSSTKYQTQSKSLQSPKYKLVSDRKKMRTQTAQFTTTAPKEKNPQQIKKEGKRRKTHNK